MFRLVFSLLMENIVATCKISSENSDHKIFSASRSFSKQKRLVVLESDKFRSKVVSTILRTLCSFVRAPLMRLDSPLVSCYKGCYKKLVQKIKMM